MPTLTSTGAVNLTSSTNWSPALVPTTGDDLIIGAHTLTLDADMTLNTIQFTNANSRFAISGTTRSVQATNGWSWNTTGTGQLCSTPIAAGMSVTLTGRWTLTGTNSSIMNGTGGNLTLRTVGANQSSVLLMAANLATAVSFISSWTGGTLTTVGLLDLTATNQTFAVFTLSGGTWSHQSVGTNTVGIGLQRFVVTSGTATVNWTGSVDSQSTAGQAGIFTLVSNSVSNTIGQTGDVFLQRSASPSGTFYTAIVYARTGTTELVGQFTGRLDGIVLYLDSSATVNWRNQSFSIPATDHCFIFNSGGVVNISGLALTNAGKFCLVEFGSGSTVASSGTSITCTSTAATACAWGTTVLDGRIVVLESSPATLPTPAQVAAGVNYGYSGAPQTGTGLIMNPATLATAMISSFSSLPEVMVRTTIATLASQTSFTLTAGSADDDVYNGLTAVITDQSTSVQKAVATISDYVGSTRTVTLSAAPGFTIATGDSITVIAGSSSGGGGLDAAGVRAAVGLASANLDTQLSGISTKTANLPADPADASDIAASFTSVNNTLATISSYIDTEVAAIKAKTDNLPADPADASDIAASFSTVNSTLATIAGYIDTEVAAIKAKTDNLPSDPADASDIAASFTTVNNTLATIAAYIDTEVSAIKLKTDNLPSDPADQSAVEAAISAAIATVPTAAQNADAVWDEPMADHTGSTTYGGRIVRATNSNVSVQITGSNHIASDVHAFQTDVIDATAFASSAVAEIQNGLATSAALTSVASNVTGIKAKTDNLPADPADASDIAASFASISGTLSTIASYIDTEVSAIKAKTDNLPSDPADQSAVEAAITAATSVLATAASLAAVASELAKVHKQGETRRFTQVARDALNKTADVTMGAPL